jgi:hypothetical protein
MIWLLIFIGTVALVVLGIANIGYHERRTRRPRHWRLD